MNKTKIAIQNLRTYLGRDKQALALLDKISMVANDLRKEARETSEKLERIEKGKAARDSRAFELRTESSRLSAELSQAKAKVVQLGRTIAQLQSQAEGLKQKLELDTPDVQLPKAVKVTPLLGAKQLSAEFSMAGVNAIFKDVRREMRQCPKPMLGYKPEHSYCYELTDVVKSLHSGELLNLGKFVATLALFGFGAQIAAQVNIAEDRQKGRKFADKDIARYLRWFRTNINLASGLKYGATPAPGEPAVGDVKIRRSAIFSS